MKIVRESLEKLYESEMYTLRELIEILYRSNPLEPAQLEGLIQYWMKQPWDKFQQSFFQDMGVRLLPAGGGLYTIKYK